MELDQLAPALIEALCCNEILRRVGFTAEQIHTGFYEGTPVCLHGVMHDKLIVVRPLVDGVESGKSVDVYAPAPGFNLDLFVATWLATKPTIGLMALCATRSL